jgi:hypothetical protein
VSDPEETLAFQIKAAKLPEPKREYRFAPPRRWKFDFAWPYRIDRPPPILGHIWNGGWQPLAAEVEGATWSGGRHTRGAGFAADCEKYNEAALLGWRVLRVTKTMVEDGRALAYIERALK